MEMRSSTPGFPNMLTAESRYIDNTSLSTVTPRALLEGIWRVTETLTLPREKRCLTAVSISSSLPAMVSGRLTEVLRDFPFTDLESTVSVNPGVLTVWVPKPVMDSISMNPLDVGPQPAGM